MNRTPLILSLALLLTVGAALWGVNYRLDHPPLSQADVEFRVSVAGADEVLARQEITNGPITSLQPLGVLDAAQTHELIENLRFTEERRPFDAIPSGTVLIDFTFRRKGADIIQYTLWQTRNSLLLVHFIPPSADPSYQVNPRFNKRLSRALDAYLPHRIRP